MSSFLSKNEDGKYIKEIESMDLCKYRINEVCCNDQSQYLGDYPYPFCKCENAGQCPFFRTEG